LKRALETIEKTDVHKNFMKDLKSKSFLISWDRSTH
jgi:hypothetical protein